MMDDNLIDIKENDIFNQDREVLSILLKDNTTKKNIIWATDNYEHLGFGYGEYEPINIDLIVGENGNVIRPRVSKTKSEQVSRSRNKAEVFTPSWLCNAQNNLVDKAWFGCDNDIFNTEQLKSWVTIEGVIHFPNTKNKTWQDYIRDTRLEIACGEAPYLVSRYDTITGDPIPVNNRIGLLDRKLRVINENTTKLKEWYEWVKIAFQNTYGYEWQGDNLILARENLLYTFIDFHKVKFGRKPSKVRIRQISRIISWNIWQMDGLKGVVPNSCYDTVTIKEDLFGEKKEIKQCCVGCNKGDIHKHNGVYCLIKDWEAKEILKFISLLK